MILRAARGFMRATRQAMPYITIFIIYSLWLLGRMENKAGALWIAALLSLLTGITIIMGRKKLFPGAQRRKRMLAEADKGRFALLMMPRDDAITTLLESMAGDYPIENISVESGIASGTYGSEKLMFTIPRTSGGDAGELALLEFYDECSAKGASRGIFFLPQAPPKGLESLVGKLAPPKILLLHSGLNSYFAKIGQNEENLPPEKSPGLAAALTKANAVRCIKAAAVMLSAYIAFGLKWFLPPALALAIFAVIARHVSRADKKLF